MRFRQLGTEHYRVLDYVTGRGYVNIGEVRYNRRFSPRHWEYRVDVDDADGWAGWERTRGEAAANLRRRFDRTNGTAPAPAVRRPVDAVTQPTTPNHGPDRAFGIEMELTGPSKVIIKNALRRVDIDVVVTGYQATNGNAWELKTDSSVAGEGLELASPKLSGADGFDQLRRVCQALASVGATVNRTCGLHVHHDMRGLSAEQIKRQVIAFVENQDIIAQLVAPSRRDHHYTPRWSAAQLRELATFDTSQGVNRLAYIGPRGAINLQAYARHGSVEIRFHGGTTQYAKIAAWVRFGQRLFDQAEAVGAAGNGLDGLNPVETVETPEALLSAIAMTSEDTSTLLRFVRAARRAALQAEADTEAEDYAEVAS